jgi:hypothetical protein
MIVDKSVWNNYDYHRLCQFIIPGVYREKWKPRARFIGDYVSRPNYPFINWYCDISISLMWQPCWKLTCCISLSVWISSPKRNSQLQVHTFAFYICYICGFSKWMYHAVLLLAASETRVYSRLDCTYIGLKQLFWPTGNYSQVKWIHIYFWHGVAIIFRAENGSRFISPALSPKNI